MRPPFARLRAAGLPAGREGIRIEVRMARDGTHVDELEIAGTKHVAVAAGVRVVAGAALGLEDGVARDREAQ